MSGSSEITQEIFSVSVFDPSVKTEITWSLEMELVALSYLKGKLDVKVLSS